MILHDGQNEKGGGDADKHVIIETVVDGIITKEIQVSCILCGAVGSIERFIADVAIRNSAP